MTMRIDRAQEDAQFSEASTVEALRSLRDNVAQDVLQHQASLAMLQALSRHGNALYSLQRGMSMVLAESLAHEARLDAALESLEAGHLDKACQILGPDH